MPPLPRLLRKSSRAALIASAALIGCGPPDAGSIKAPAKDEMTKTMFPEAKTKSGKTVEGNSQATPIPKKR